MTIHVPGFAWKPISANFTNGGMRNPPLGLVLHVAEGNGGLQGWFSRSSTRASAHFWVGKNGQREQYVSADDKAWAEVAGNGLYLSVETEGFHGEPLTDAQINSVAALMAWGHKTFGWPLVVTDTPGNGGLICHGVPTATGFTGRASWGGHVCPGRLRSDQRPEILRRAGGQPVPAPTPSGDDEVSVLPTIQPGHDKGHPASEQLFCDLVNKIQPDRKLDMSSAKAGAREQACKDFEVFFKIPGSVKSDGTGDGYCGVNVWRTLLAVATKGGK